MSATPCGMEWHYGTLARINHSDPDSPTGWRGIHGALTTNASGICDDCTAEWRANHPGQDLPRPVTLVEGPADRLWEPEVHDCTCCDPPRPAVFDPATKAWVHTDDDEGEGGTEASMLHVHTHTAGRDCDGLMEHYYVTRPTQLRNHAELENATVLIAGRRHQHYEVHDFWPGMVKLALYPWAHEGKSTVEITEETDGHRFRQHRPTEEGFSEREMWECKDPGCAFDGASQRDHSAEAAGY